MNVDELARRVVEPSLLVVEPERLAGASGPDRRARVPDLRGVQRLECGIASQRPRGVTGDGFRCGRTREYHPAR